MKKQVVTPGVIKKLSTGQWVETKYQGKTYLVSLKSLLDAYIMRSNTEL